MRNRTTLRAAFHLSSRKHTRQHGARITRAMLDAGIFVGGKPLDAPETATTVRLGEGKSEIHDGPYSNTKEQLGGFTLLELPSLDAALEGAARSPAASYGTVEVRPIAVELEPRVTVAS